MSENSEIKVQYKIDPHGEKIAFIKRDGNAACLVWLCGYHSDMSGSKAQTMDDFAKQNGFASLRFDYSGHGLSSGKFDEGTISKWLNEAQFILDSIEQEKIILIGSSMGGWISLLLALRNLSRIAGLVLCAPAPDFTEDLMWNSFSDDVKKQIIETGYWLRPNDYDEPYKVTKALLDDGRTHLIMDGPINIDVPVTILHGMQDADVPFERSLALAQKLKSENVKIELFKTGGHRLSEPQELAALYRAIAQICEITL